MIRLITANWVKPIKKNRAITSKHVDPRIISPLVTDRYKLNNPLQSSSYSDVKNNPNESINTDIQQQKQKITLKYQSTKDFEEMWQQQQQQQSKTSSTDSPIDQQDMTEDDWSIKKHDPSIIYQNEPIHVTPQDIIDYLDSLDMFEQVGLVRYYQTGTNASASTVTAAAEHIIVATCIGGQNPKKTAMNMKKAFEAQDRPLLDGGRRLVSRNESVEKSKGMLAGPVISRAAAGSAKKAKISGHEDWYSVDFGDVIVHLLEPEARRFYDIDGLYGDSITIIEAELEEKAEEGVTDEELQEKAEGEIQESVHEQADEEQVSCEADGELEEGVVEEQAIGETDSFEVQAENCTNGIILNEKITSPSASEESRTVIQPSDFAKESMPDAAETVMPKETESNDQSNHTSHVNHANHANSILWSH